MATIIVQLDPAKLGNPGLDIRYVLPDLLVSRAGGLLSDGRYDYAEDPAGTKLLFLQTDEPDAAVPSRNAFTRVFSLDTGGPVFLRISRRLHRGGARRGAEGSSMLAIRLRLA